MLICHAKKPREQKRPRNRNQPFPSSLKPVPTDIKVRSKPAVKNPAMRLTTVNTMIQTIYQSCVTGIGLGRAPIGPLRIVHGDVRERPKRHDWKSCDPRGSKGSNPFVSAYCHPSGTCEDVGGRAR